MADPDFYHWLKEQASRTREEAAAELMRQPAQASPKFFYDALGSHLFDAITLLDEYTATRDEAQVMAQHGAAMASAIQAALGSAYAMVDLGAGSCAKAEALFAHLQPNLKRYVAVDISADYLRQAVLGVQKRNPSVSVAGVAADFSAQLALPPAALAGHQAVLGFYPGSSISNFAPPAARALLSQVRALAPRTALLIGVDTVKPKAVLEPAYDDAIGVTAAFNLNLLRQLNRLLGANFEPRQWQHVALFNESESRIEMHLQAKSAQTVCWPGGERHFAAGERIHTENSYKWQPEGFAGLLREVGFDKVQVWTYAKQAFAVLLATG